MATNTGMATANHPPRRSAAARAGRSARGKHNVDRDKQPGRLKRKIGRIAAIAVPALLLFLLSISVTVAGVLRDARPDFTLRLWPLDGLAKAAKAERVLAEGRGARNLDEVRALSLAALRAEPTSARAARLLAILSSDYRTADRRFDYANRLTRRDLPTNLWLIEDAVRQNDIPRALRHYDIALRTSSAARPLLFPVLDAALGQPHLVRPIGGLLANGQPWVAEFVEFSAGAGSRVGPLARALMSQPRSLDNLPVSLKQRLISVLVDQREFDIAAAIYDRFTRGEAQADRSTIRGFSHAGRWPPFDWVIVSTGDFGASLLDQEGPLSFHAQTGGTGLVARQLVSLRPGSYRLAVSALVAPDASSGSAAWQLTCVEPSSRPLAEIELAGAVSDTPRRSDAFDVAGADCRHQWLALYVRSTVDGRVEGTVNRIAILPVSAPRPRQAQAS